MTIIFSTRTLKRAALTAKMEQKDTIRFRLLFLIVNFLDKQLVFLQFTSIRYYSTDVAASFTYSLVFCKFRSEAHSK